MNTQVLRRYLIPIAYANIFIFWGSTYVAISYGLESFPPFILSGFRFLTAGLLLFPILRFIKKERADVWANWKKNAVTGTLVLTGGTGLVMWAEQYVSATEAAIAIAAGPFWFMVLDKKNWKLYFSNKFILAGLVIGFSGLVLFLQGSLSGHAVSTQTQWRAIAFAVLASSSIAWVLGSLYSRNHKPTQSTIMNITQQLIIGGIGSFAIATLRGEWVAFSVPDITTNALLGLLFLVFFGSIVAYLSYIWLLTVQPAALVSTHIYVNPIVAVILGWLLLGTQISNTQLLGLTVILSGVLLTNVGAKLKTPAWLKSLSVKLLRTPAAEKPTVA